MWNFETKEKIPDNCDGYERKGKEKMKKALFVLVVLAVGFARADNIVTSREYVDTQANALQSELPAKNENTVLLNTVTAGEVGEKAIYDSTASYAEQTDALVTAGTFNSAVQNALDSEFVCIERQNGNGGCLLYEIRGATQKQILPSGYTQLEYLESTGTQYIDTETLLNGASKLEFKFMTDAQNNYAIFGAGNGRVYNQGEISLFYFQYSNGNSVIEAVRPTSNSSSTIIVPRPNISPNIAYTISYDKNNLIVNGKSQSSNWKVGFVGTRSAYLFACNRGADSWLGGNTKIYYFKIYNDNTLVRNFIPARRDSDNTLGMYDTVSGTFFTNRGTGTFVAGPVVSSNLYLPSGN